MDCQTGEPVAIKQVPLSGIASDNLQSVMGEIDLLKTLQHRRSRGEGVAGAGALALARPACSALTRLRRPHPVGPAGNIVKYLGSFKTRKDLYIIMEFMDNGQSRRRRRSGQPWPFTCPACRPPTRTFTNWKLTVRHALAPYLCAP